MADLKIRINVDTSIAKQSVKSLANSFEELTTKGSLNILKGSFSTLITKIKTFGELGRQAFITLKNSIFNVRNAIVALIASFSAVQFSKSIIAESNKIENSMLGLQAIAKYTGIDFEQLKQTAESLASDGLMTVAEASTALRNLLLRGFNLEQSIQMINRLKDAASVARQGSLELGEAVVTATEGLKNENSILVDNAGVTKNVSVMWKEYAQQIGKSVSDLTLAEKRQAEYNGIMKETEVFMGSASRQTETFQGKVSQLSVAWRMVKQNLGDSFKSALKSALEGIVSFVTKLNTLIQNNKDQIEAFFRVVVIKALELGIGLAEGLGKGIAFMYRMATAIDALQIAFEVVQVAVQGLISVIAKLIEVILYVPSLGGKLPVLGDMFRWAKEQAELYGKSAEENLNKISSNIDDIKNKLNKADKVEVQVETTNEWLLDELKNKLQELKEDANINATIQTNEEGYQF